VKPRSQKPDANRQSTASGGEVVELSRFRAELGRGRRLRRADVLLDAPSPRNAVRALPGDEFYYVIHELGFPEAAEILQHGTPEQVQTALDFALWDKDQLAANRVDEWLGYLIEAPPATLSAWVRGLDIELFALIVRQRAHVHDISETEGEPPDEVEGTLWFTPDRFFALDLLGDEEAQRITRNLCDFLYRMDRDWMRRILVGLRAELDSELEELAYRWRSGRMADLGFEDYYDALEVYRELDPASVKPGSEPTARVRTLGDSAEDSDEPFLRLPTGLTERLSGGAPFARAVAGVTDKEELTNLQAALVMLSNRVLAADRVTPGDDPAVEAALTRLSATLDLAVEFLGRGDPALAVKAVRSVPLVRLFQVGASLTGKVRRLARTLLKKTPFALVDPPLDLFEHEDSEVLTSCGRLRPLFPRILDVPPAPGERPFAALADLAVATAALERAAAAVALLLALGARAEDVAQFATASPAEAAGLDAGVIGRALLVRRWLGEPGGLQPLPAKARARLEAEVARAAVDPQHRAALAEELARAAPLPGAIGSAAPAVAAVLARWIEGVLAGVPQV
jgi:hypothetical protein